MPQNELHHPYRNLKLYLELGLRLTYVHCVLSFDESDFLENENLFQKTGVPFFSWNH